jgi:hypothetical protein
MSQPAGPQSAKNASAPRSAIALPVPTAGVDPRVALATSMQAAPGMYAVLVGSGMSTAAGIPTGWKVVQDLIRRVAIAEGVDRDVVADEPAKWWKNQGRPEPRYDTLLSDVAKTDGARRALLRGYFDPPPGQGGPIRPTAGHQALAQLGASGRVRVILTTNFDRLIERALDEVGLSPQVIASPTAVGGMVPLVHAPMTVLKLHGDYEMEGLLNTPEELARYPKEWQDLLARVFDEFGLIIVGWSGDYDTALADAIRNSPSRRYPIFWTLLDGSLKENARRLIDLRRATVIDTHGADEFFVDIAKRVRRLDEIAARRSRPTALRTYSYMPNSTVVSVGWNVQPLLQLRVVTTVGPATLDNCGILEPRHRTAIVDGLRSASITAQLRTVAAAPAASAKPDPTIPHVSVGVYPLVEDWELTPGGHQTTEHAAYRLGGDGEIGVSALVWIAFPRYATTGAVKFTIDVGLSLAQPISLGEAAKVLRDALVSATTTLPDAIADTFPTDAELTHAEVHLLAANAQPNQLLLCIDLAMLGERSRDLGQSMGYAVRLSDALGEREATELVIDAINLMALDHGFVDPTIGIDSLRYELGLSSPTTP